MTKEEEKLQKKISKILGNKSFDLILRILLRQVAATVAYTTEQIKENKEEYSDDVFTNTIEFIASDVARTLKLLDAMFHKNLDVCFFTLLIKENIKISHNISDFFPTQSMYKEIDINSEEGRMLSALFFNGGSPPEPKTQTKDNVTHVNFKDKD